MRWVKRNIGSTLLERGEISKDQLDAAMKVHETAQKSGEELVDLGIISSGELEILLDLQLAEILVGMGYVDEKKLFGSLRIGIVQEDYSPMQQFAFFDPLDF